MDFIRRVRNASRPKVVVGSIVGGAAAVVVAPIALSAIGITAGGIAAGSIATSMISVLQGVGAVGAIGNGALILANGVNAVAGYVFKDNHPEQPPVQSVSKDDDPVTDVLSDSPVEALNVSQPIVNDDENDDDDDSVLAEPVVPEIANNNSLSADVSTSTDDLVTDIPVDHLTSQEVGTISNIILK